MYVPCAEDLPPTSGIGWFTIEDEYGDGSRAIGTSVTFIQKKKTKEKYVSERME